MLATTKTALADTRRPQKEVLASGQEELFIFFQRRWEPDCEANYKPLPSQTIVSNALFFFLPRATNEGGRCVRRKRCSTI